MIGNISSTSATTNVQPPPAAYRAASASSSGASSSSEDTVQLSAETQQHLANAKSSAPAQPSIGQIVKEAADGDINALAKLALIA